MQAQEDYNFNWQLAAPAGRNQEKPAGGFLKGIDFSAEPVGDFQKTICFFREPVGILKKSFFSEKPFGNFENGSDFKKSNRDFFKRLGF